MIYKTHGTCSREIIIETDGDIVTDVAFVGGCNGNTQGISSLVKGMKIQDVIDRTEGIDCNGRGTSCPDQLSKALKKILAEQNGGN
jgi:uncharacterized protein (TIGR03905 family)